MKKTFLFVIIILFVFSNGCSENTNDINFLGPPTVINLGENPLDVMRRIYIEFVELEKPVLKEIIFHKEGSRSKRVDVVNFTTETLPSYYQYILTQEANDFIRKHSIPEIIATLFPIVMHPENGGEAAVLITGIFTNYQYRVHEYGRHVSTLSEYISKYLYNTGYKSISEKGKWNTESAIAFDFYRDSCAVSEIVLASRQLTLISTREEYKAGIKKYQENTLHYQLSQILNDVHGYESFVPTLQFTKADTFEDWRKVNPCPPILDPDFHRQISEQYQKDFILLGLYPSRLKPGFIVHTLGLKEYWPIAYRCKMTTRYYVLSQRYYQDWYKFEKEYKRKFKEEIFNLAMSNYDPKQADKAN